MKVLLCANLAAIYHNGLNSRFLAFKFILKNLTCQTQICLLIVNLILEKDFESAINYSYSITIDLVNIRSVQNIPLQLEITISGHLYLLLESPNLVMLQGIGDMERDVLKNKHSVRRNFKFMLGQFLFLFYNKAGIEWEERKWCTLFLIQFLCLKNSSQSLEYNIQEYSWCRIELTPS